MSRTTAPTAILFLVFNNPVLPAPFVGVASGRHALNQPFNALATGRLWRATNSGSGLQRTARLNAPPMRFLSTLFWVLLAVVVALFASRNWNSVTLNLWGDIQADVKIPILVLIAFLLGFLPTWLVMRARVWSFRRRLEGLERPRAPAEPEPAPAEEGAPAV